MRTPSAQTTTASIASLESNSASLVTIDLLIGQKTFYATMANPLH